MVEIFATVGQILIGVCIYLDGGMIIVTSLMKLCLLRHI